MAPRRANVRGRGTESEASMHGHLRVRFWAKVDTSGDCWTWTAGTNEHGYGTIRYGGPGGGRSTLAHRVSWELENGPIPVGMFVLHRCDNPPCVRPDHLYLGGYAENSRDTVERHRFGDRSGERNARAKLTDAQASAIRSAYAAGTRQVDLARRYGVSRGTIWCIVHDRNWTKVA